MLQHARVLSRVSVTLIIPDDGGAFAVTCVMVLDAQMFYVVRNVSRTTIVATVGVIELLI